MILVILPYFNVLPLLFTLILITNIFTFLWTNSLSSPTHWVRENSTGEKNVLSGLQRPGTFSEESFTPLYLPFHVYLCHCLSSSEVPFIGTSASTLQTTTGFMCTDTTPTKTQQGIKGCLHDCLGLLTKVSLISRIVMYITLCHR